MNKLFWESAADCSLTRNDQGLTPAALTSFTSNDYYYNKDKKYDEAENYIYNQIVDFGLQSKGTHKIFALLGPILDTIENNKIK